MAQDKWRISGIPSREGGDTTPDAGRSALDKVVVRVPVLATWAAAGLSRLRPGSRLRRRLLGFGLNSGFAAVNRSDVEVVRLNYEREIEVWTSGMEATGLRDCYRGHDGLREMFAELDDVFSSWGWAVGEVVDLGDRLAVCIDFTTRGRSSGVETTVKGAGAAYRLSSRGKIRRQDFYMEEDGWQRALDAVGAA